MQLQNRCELEVKKDYEIIIYWRMNADQFLGKKTEASA